MSKTSLTESIKQIAVIGSGQMGSGIAQTFATFGYSVSLYDANPQALEKGVQQIDKQLSRNVEKQKITEEKRKEIFSKITTISKLADLSNADCVIEAIVEQFEAKKALFSELDSICKKSALFASNTSSISITKLAHTTKRPEQFIGMHFMNPVPVMELVEVIRGLQTSDTTYETTLELAKTIEKTTVTAHKDYPGFLVNRILIPMLNEAIFVLMEGIATPEEIDLAMKLGTNHPMGPLELADFVGLDTCLSISQILHRELGDDKYRPCPLLTKYVEAGWLGKKVGRGFYNHK